MALDLITMRTVTATPGAEDGVTTNDHNDTATNVRTLGVNFDDASEPTAVQIVAGRLYSRTRDDDGGLYHALKEKTGDNAGETDWKKLAVPVAHIHVINGYGEVLSATDEPDAVGRRRFRPYQLILSQNTGELFYLNEDAYLTPVRREPREELDARRWIGDPATSIVKEEHAGTNGVWDRLVFPDAVTSAAFTMIRHGQGHNNFGFKLDLYFSAAATGTAKMRLGYRDIRPGDTVDSADDGTLDFDVVVASANVLVQPTTSYISLYRVESGPRMLRLKLSRLGGDAGDTIAGALHFYGARTLQRSEAEEVLL